MGQRRSAFSDDERAFIQGSIGFFLATADAEGQPDCSFRGGPAEFVQVTGARVSACRPSGEGDRLSAQQRLQGRLSVV